MPRSGHASRPSWAWLLARPSDPNSTPLPSYSEALLPSVSEKTASGCEHCASHSKPRSGRLSRLAVLLGVLCLVFISAGVLYQTWRPRAETQSLAQHSFADPLESLPEDTDEVPPEDTLDVEIEEPLMAALHDPFAVKNFVQGPPTVSFKDNLKDDLKYITSWQCAGWTNDVMSVANTIYLGLLTERIPILPAFAPSHLPLDAGYIPVGDIFDVPGLAAAIHSPILEWRDVKDVNSTLWESVGCWSSWMGASVEITEPRFSRTPETLKLDVSYTPVPHSMKALGEGDWHVLLNRLMQLGFPSGRAETLSQKSPLPSPGALVTLEPDDQMMCLDFMYFTSVDRNLEWEYDWSPQWRLVGKHMKWAPALQGLANEYLNRHFGTPLDGPVPPYISAHLRRGDFKNRCHDGKGGFSCLPTMGELREKVQDIKDALALKLGSTVDRVLIMSDETDPEWWEEIRENGWTWIDHAVEETDEKYGKWYTPVLDAVFMSMGAGFIGTEASTMSLVGERRVQDWHGGPTARLRWHGI